MKQDLAPEVEASLDRRFADLVARQMRECPYVRGAMAFIEEQALRVPLFIASGAPEAELRAIVEDRGLAAHFRGVFGSPRDKVTLLTTIASASGIALRDLVFIGDGRQDYEAARSLGMPFVGIVPPSAPVAFPEAVLVAADLDELARRWAEVSAVLNPESR